MMWRGALVLVVALLAGCTKKNEEKYCTEQTCTTPDFPFCDVTGFASGEAGTCIAVTCTAGEFGECRGDQEVRCNDGGTNYNIVQCERGCDPDADGCRLCDPNETACTNGTVATCNASGAVISKQQCPLGCFEDEPRCRDIAPSNDLSRFFDMVTNAPDIALSNGATLDTTTGTVTSANGSMTLQSFLVPAPAGGSAIRVIVAGNVTLGDVVVWPGPSTDGPALAILASGTVAITGAVDFGYADSPTAGGVSSAGCRGGSGTKATRNGQTFQTGDGGGGHATAGGAGGGIDVQSDSPGTAGAASGTETLVPLRGGCAGTYSGGGAIQISSLKRIDITGSINVDGGYGLPDGNVIPSGGAGGGILLEAPAVSLGAAAKLLANGGSGASCSAAGQGSVTLAPAMGGAGSGMYCGAGGNGAAVGVAATSGMGSSYTNSPSVTFFAGGAGGGGLGRIRINTRDGTYVKANTTIEAAALTTGSLATR